ncbi:MAG TPA: hypothetical protein PKN86_08380 [Candidatus Obscuribacter sp.]|nr:hypothetical protein [Candidatus Obscuribacter sp.]MBK9277605.1 hypothetical protein [Candidatus Obscuribacter sp.]MBL8085699.1 hypothetical protein [Candidatus Obscuribacter sp.]HMW90123.1 hypothetical protein [Candidatus Obscuribacter sp.]HMY51836.1 hypothetical protein [Candidatus Obscuribacter sp.]
MGLSLILFLCFVAWIGGHLLDRLLTMLQANMTELFESSSRFGPAKKTRKTTPSNVIILPALASNPKKLDGKGQVRLSSYTRGRVVKRSETKKLSRQAEKGNLTGDPDVQGVR